MQGYRAWGFRGCSVVGIGFETWMEVFGTATASIGEESDELDWSTIKLAGRSGDSKHHRLPSVYFSPILNPRPQALNLTSETLIHRSKEKGKLCPRVIPETLQINL